MSDLNKRDLDNYISGHGGEDQIRDSPYDRLMAANEHKAIEYAESLRRAQANRYAVIRVSKLKSRVIQQLGHARIGYGTTDVLEWEFASEPLSHREVGPELKRLRGEA